jgi:tRNA pseudouridine13 synthase
VEKFLLNGLITMNKNDYLGAFQFLPRNMRLMYLHAYQSYIWNFAASKRIELYGLKPHIGDLVRCRAEIKHLKNKALKEKSAVTTAMTDDVIYLDEENIANFSIYDVVLPLPGFDVLYPKHGVKDYYEELLKKDEISMDGFKNKIKDFSLSGDYRAVVVKPADFKYEIVHYETKSKPLAESDLDLILNNNADKSSNKEEENSCGNDNKPTSVEVAIKKYKGLVIEFNLPSSTYATVALREILLD